MLTRAYDAIMASLQIPDNTNNQDDFNVSSIDDSVFNCKNFKGDIRCINSPGRLGTGFMQQQYCYNLPFVCWSVNGGYTVIFPDEDSSDPNYEDYIVSERSPSNWAASSQRPIFKKTYDLNTKEHIGSITVLWQNTSGVAKTVYGLRVSALGYYRPTYAVGTASSDRFLVCREHFSAPVVVEDQGIISLTFTWRVGRAGLVSATAAAAE